MGLEAGDTVRMNVPPLDTRQPGFPSFTYGMFRESTGEVVHTGQPPGSTEWWVTARFGKDLDPDGEGWSVTFPERWLVKVEPREGV